ncbi:alpha/beta fold hydrolase [Jiangella mangrovi]|uniref:Pimeloyl-ACP methyl ester carboxylesterase n=1 Tax=Jiangella mangrovi TaxID=1524084 RepID=A0A7W9LNY0_9ACTN|nr:alpha/beta hydrolase [Jiangella mangrovi]MBB5790798.1 pimeloyl-ACP methyl ester carboxylesterase [Jiangella mangrovi]
MSVAHVNGVDIYYELHGAGVPMALVHGSWTDATRWELVLPGLTDSFQVMVYDRRGHSRSQGADGRGSVDEDGDDLAGLLETLALAPAHVVANSWGGNVALRLACRRPELFRSLTCHEPPLWGLLENDPDSRAMLASSSARLEAVGVRIAAGDHEGGARIFVDEVVFGPGTWDGELPPEFRELLVRNAPTFLDELRDPDQLSVDEHALTTLEVPVWLTDGSASPPVFARVIDRLEDLIPIVGRETFEGAGHAIQSTMPDTWVAATKRAVGWATGRPAAGGPP